MAKPRGKPFKKGQSGNPSGRPAVVKEVQELAREHTDAAIQALVDIAKDDKKPSAARVSAATALLDRGYGRPAQTVNVNQRKSIEDISDDELIAIARQADAESSGNGIAAKKGGAGPSDSVH